MTPTITWRRMRVLTDGKAHEGVLVLANGCLAAVLVQVSAEEASPEGRGGWFLEAGFGPCGDLLVSRPPVFPDFDQAQAWVRGRVAAQPRRA